MAKYDKNTKFYWLQLKEDFFEDDAIEWLEEQKPNGRDYAYFYLKLCLKSLKTNGVLIRKVGKILIPYDNLKLAELTKMDFDTVTVAMELLKQIGLVQILENGEIYINQLEDLIGSKSIGAFKKQQQRFLKNSVKNIEGGQEVDKCPPKIDIDIDIDIDIEKEIDNSKNTNEKNFSKVIDFYNNNINLISPFEFQKLQDYSEMEEDLIIYAIQKAVTANVRKFNYIDAILRNWQNKGFKTLILAKNEENEYKKNKNKDALEEFMNEHTEI